MISKYFVFYIAGGKSLTPSASPRHEKTIFLSDYFINVKDSILVLTIEFFFLNNKMLIYLEKDIG